jgi:ABC-type multidrug transport system fused ATPase/permease subunit
LGTLWRWVRQSMVDVEQVLNIMETNDKIPEVENPVPVNIKEATIEFKDVEFTYDIKLPNEEQRTVLKQVSFTVPAGKSVGIVGQTGSGKSTIMRLLYRFYDVTGGKILIDGQDISQMALSELRSQIAIVP